MLTRVSPSLFAPCLILAVSGIPAAAATPVWDRHDRLACEGAQQYWCSMGPTDAECRIEQSDLVWAILLKEGRVEYLNTDFEEAIVARLSKTYQGIVYDHLLLESGRVLFLAPPLDPDLPPDTSLVARAALGSLSPPLMAGAEGFPAGGYAIITWMECHSIIPSAEGAP